ncbi:DNA replication and repair protein RecF [Gimesia chilikensis]|uniref:DNA replication and repair protein RecF n=1 Tax=Gimesia chilikensis TaxID=2605989 RepID=A0A517W6Z3_9PLAN|nr:ATP-dependent endonuclease [Gimesia chilikensis]QDU01028.1 DNA replication and repair protein RecF [Gimesia chilikensis]
MKLIEVSINGFRRLENVQIEFDEQETVFVGPNNSGKTSAAEVFRLFLKSGDFSIHDFSVSKVAQFDKFAQGEIEQKDLPSITLDLWFSLDPDTEFGRAGLLLPDAEQDYEKVGLRLRYMVADGTQLKEEYQKRLTPQSGSESKKSLSYYLSMPGTLKKHFVFTYYALERGSDEVIEHPLTPEEGKRVLRSLIRVEFVDAQRKIDDHENPGSTRLSNVFTRYYRRNLIQAEVADEANGIIDQHNDALTNHYANVFSELLGVIQGLGVPSVNDRKLRVTSALIPGMVLQSNANLTYYDEHRKHELPESYNGLGIKNLIYLAIQICEFHLNWMSTEDVRPLSLVIFIEEPEAHLHAQAQQTFITNAWKIINEASQRCNEEMMTPQLVITTHSSHILDTVDFEKVRYFRRCRCEGDDPGTKTLNASVVKDLQKFDPLKKTPTEKKGVKKKTVPKKNQKVIHSKNRNEDAKKTLDFLKRYLKLTHCDLFFADAVILVEGTVEKLLLPQMIDSEASGLNRRYLTVLEVGGAYAHRFASLLEFISVPYLVITDIDSVSPTDSRVACRADKKNAVTSNATLKYFFNCSSIKDLLLLKAQEQEILDCQCYVAFQRPSKVEGYANSKPMHGRTLEETFVYENIELFRKGSLSFINEELQQLGHEEEYETIYTAVRNSTFKKTEFALIVASTDIEWNTPKYIVDGLKWLEQKLHATDLNGKKDQEND